MHSLIPIVCLIIVWALFGGCVPAEDPPQSANEEQVSALPPLEQHAVLTGACWANGFPIREEFNTEGKQDSGKWTRNYRVAHFERSSHMPPKIA